MSSEPKIRSTRYKPHIVRGQDGFQSHPFNRSHDRASVACSGIRRTRPSLPHDPRHLRLPRMKVKRWPEVSMRIHQSFSLATCSREPTRVMCTPPLKHHQSGRGRSHPPTRERERASSELGGSDVRSMRHSDQRRPATNTLRPIAQNDAPICVRHYHFAHSSAGHPDCEFRLGRCGVRLLHCRVSAISPAYPRKLSPGTW